MSRRAAFFGVKNFTFRALVIQSQCPPSLRCVGEEERVMADEERKMDGVWLSAIVITAVNGALFLALFAGIAGL